MLEPYIEESIDIITTGFKVHETKIKDFMRAYSLISTPIIETDDIGNCFDHIENLLDIKLVPSSYIKGETEVNKVMSYHKQQFIETL